MTLDSGLVKNHNPQMIAKAKRGANLVKQVLDFTCGLVERSPFLPTAR
ncbi:hypothetical protein [Nostoc sp.]